MIQIHSEGALLHLHVKPKASRSGVIGVHDDRLKVAVTAAPERGKANAAVVDVIAKELGLRRSQLSILAGETSALKSLLIRDIAPEELRRRVETTLRASRKSDEP